MPPLREHQQGTYLLSTPPAGTNGAPSIDYNITDETLTYFDQNFLDDALKGPRLQL